MCITDCCTAHYTRVISPLWCSAFHNTMLHSEPKSLLSCNEQSSIELCSIALPTASMLVTNSSTLVLQHQLVNGMKMCGLTWRSFWRPLILVNQGFRNESKEFILHKKLLFSKNCSFDFEAQAQAGSELPFSVDCFGNSWYVATHRAALVELCLLAACSPSHVFPPFLCEPPGPLVPCPPWPLGPWPHGPLDQILSKP